MATLMTISTRIAAWLLFAIVAAAPLPFGSFEPSAVAFWCVALGICLVLGAAVPPLSGRQLVLAGLFGVVVAAYAFVLHEQLSEHPWITAATPDPIWHQAEKALGHSLTPSLSIARNQPWFDLGRPLVCMLAIACGFLIGTDRVRARQLLKVIAWSGSAYAAYGIIAHIFDPTRILWRDKEAYLGYVTGTFINRNTAGAYFGSCAIVWSLILWERIRVETPRGPVEWQKIPTRLLTAPPPKVIAAFAMLFLCLAATFMTGSRAAVVLSLFALIVAFIAFFRRDLSGRSGLITALAGCSAAALILIQIMGAGVNARFDVQGTADEGRLAVYKSTLRMIADHPWFGTGQGTFAYAFPAYRSPDMSMWWVWDIAHNSLLEIASDMGIPIAILVAVAWLVIFGALIYGGRFRRRDLIIPVAALGVTILAVLHSLVDFTLQIPGYSIPALSLIGAGLAQSLGEKHTQRASKDEATVFDVGYCGKPSQFGETFRMRENRGSLEGPLNSA